jgi:NDP-sugar pyrophosphorylase family protein
LGFVRRQGISRVLFCSGYLAGTISNHFGDGARFAMEVSYSIESSPAGTGGALRQARDKLQEVFYVLNGDTFFDTDLASLSRLMSAHPSLLAAVALRWVPNVETYGSVRLECGRIQAFAEKQGRGPGLINGGIYCLRREALDVLAASSSLEKDLFPALAEASRLGGVAADGYFIDIGLPETFARAQVELPARFARERAGT